MGNKRQPTKVQLAKIRMIIFDLDGVMTDNFVHIDEDGRRSKRFWVPDGVGVFMAHKAGIKMAIITGNQDQSTRHRAEYLKISDIYQGAFDKFPVYEELKRKYGLSDADCLFIGDDLPDRPVFQRVGLSLAPVDAHPQIKRLAKWIGTMPGGRGIVREAIDAVLAARGFEWPSAPKKKVSSQ